MIVIEQSCLLSILTLTLLIRQTIDAVAGRCYLCSQHTLPECAGSNQPNSPIYSTVLRYYTEPCNGQCVFFRNDNQSVVRGCSWTYGHMQPKSTGWHEISPGVSAYFCDSPFCNNGTFEDQLTSTARTEITRNQVPLPLEQLLAIATNQPTDLLLNQSSPRRLRQCYACTARYKGCGEFLDPAYVSNYIRPCSSSCIVFRNPNDLNLITRDCSGSWPEVRGKSGLHRILGSEAFFCEESLCNGIGFDFIMGIFHNQLPALIRFPLTSTLITTTIINPDDDDPFIDDEVDSTTVSLSETFNNGSLSTENFDVDDDLEMSTIKDSLVAVQEQLPMNWWNLNETTSTMVEDEWIIFNTTSVPFVTRLGHLSADDEDSDEIYSDRDSQSNHTASMNDFLPSPQITTTTTPTPNTTVTSFRPSSTTIRTVLLDQPFVPETTTKPYVETLFEYCKDQECHNGGRLNSDCLCICLPAFTGESCQTVLCDQEPAHICNFVFEYECQSDYVQYLCPKFCATKLCPPTSADDWNPRLIGEIQ